MEDQLIYHYCSNETMYNIVKGKQLWMSDISRSNDYAEMRVFKPGIFFAVEEAYTREPFHFEYRHWQDLEAIQHLLIEVERYIDDTQNSGFLTSFVVCFSENGDMLSQWRGYANNGKGCSLGFSLAELQQYCHKHEDYIDIRQVIYINKDSLTEFQNKAANFILSIIRDLRSDARRLLPSTLTENEFENGVYFLALRCFENFMYNSLQYKWDAFSEEREWRMFFRGITKDDLTLYGDANDLPEWKQQFDKDYKYLHEAVDFYAKDNCLIPYYPVKMSDISENAIKKLYLGPKNISYKQDIQLLFTKEKIGKPEIEYSSISYR